MASLNELRSIAASIKTYCEEHSDPAIVQKYSRYFKDGYDAYGLTKELFEQKKQEILSDCSHLLVKDFLKLGDLLIQSEKYEEKSFAITLLPGRSDQFDLDAFHHVSSWLENGIQNWAHTDVLCGKVVSLFINQNVIALSDFSPWRESPSRWKRRAVPVSLLVYLKTMNEFGPLLEMIEPLMLDPDRVVHQGLGWFLREAWKKQPAPVEIFLLKWKDRAPRLIVQYATEKMSKADKEKFRRTSKK